MTKKPAETREKSEDQTFVPFATAATAEPITPEGSKPRFPWLGGGNTDESAEEQNISKPRFAWLGGDDTVDKVDEQKKQRPRASSLSGDDTDEKVDEQKTPRPRVAWFGRAVIDAHQVRTHLID